MQYKSFEEYRKHVDNIISDNINKFLSDDKLNEIVEITTTIANENHLQLTNEQYEAIIQISLIVSKAVAKHTVYATIESLHDINETLPDR